MAHSAPPTGDDLKAFLITGKPPLMREAALPAEEYLADYAAAAWEDWQRMTGWDPFQQSGAAVARYFSPPLASSQGIILDLAGGLIEAPTEVLTFHRRETAGSGRALTLYTDYKLIPFHTSKGVDSWPVDFMQFMTDVGGAPDSIKITGKWGYLTGNLPSGVWIAVLQLASIYALTGGLGPTGVIKRLDQGPVKTEYDTAQGTASSLLTSAKRTISQYRRI